MSDEEDDYLSDKFLLAASAPEKPQTYLQRRKEAEKRAHERNVQNRKKSRRQLEQEAREEGLSKSLFERAAEEARAAEQVKEGKAATAEGQAPVGNKALAMMMKMGFKPGQSLGRKEEEEAKEEEKKAESSAPTRSPSASAATTSRHLINPIAINEWSGKVGIGVKRRPPSPTSTEMIAKMAKMADETKHVDFRDRARQEYLERRAHGQLNPEDRDTFPPGLIEALEQQTAFTMPLPRDPRRDDDIEGRLRRQMHKDRLRPLNAEDADEGKATAVPEFEQSTLEEACQFLRLPYDDEEDMAKNCPGPSEDDHD
ncbi:hypothetical protein GGG16DRAFT_100858 [Schizophyllum commune]